ncbi:hypothetical protein [Saccharomonospora xinjiangensis]|uniref:Integral membrane protein n=1 Tax=Saccharomonospora xinjiangensis XJ-54 TaxID=882086 RepID=I0V2B0_9PSEU|nr:hypothetical protein [Saccharomonospora xinjiangensis]EID54263.1 hypothetical protein SacxiDRAFT_2028 [Saccharomonospora xinjiangensis XJ-54]
MIAVTRYHLALLLTSQRYLPPTFAFLVLLAVLYTSADAPVAPEFAVSAGGLVVVSCWLTVAVVDLEDPVHRLVTIVHARGPATVVAGVVAAVLVVSSGSAAISLGWAWLLHGGFAADEWLLGVGAHVAATCTGIAIGLPCSRFVVPKIGFTVVAALATLGIVLFVRWIPLVNPMLRALGSGSEAGGAVLVAAVTSAALLVLSAGFTAAVHRS